MIFFSRSTKLNRCCCRHSSSKTHKFSFIAFLYFWEKKESSRKNNNQTPNHIKMDFKLIFYEPITCQRHRLLLYARTFLLSFNFLVFLFTRAYSSLSSIEKAHTPKIKFYYNDLETFSHLREQQKNNKENLSFDSSTHNNNIILSDSSHSYIRNECVRERERERATTQIMWNWFLLLHSIEVY